MADAGIDPGVARATRQQPRQSHAGITRGQDGLAGLDLLASAHPDAGGTAVQDQDLLYLSSAVDRPARRLERPGQRVRQRLHASDGTAGTYPVEKSQEQQRQRRAILKWWCDRGRGRDEGIADDRVAEPLLDELARRHDEERTQILQRPPVAPGGLDQPG